MKLDSHCPLISRRETVWRLICWNVNMIELVGEYWRVWCEISVNRMWGLHREGSFLKTPLPFCTSWCYHNPGPRVDLLWLMASSSASTRVHHIICWEGQTLHPVKWGRGGAAMSGTGKGSGRDRDEVREWKEQSTISIRRLSSLIYKQQFRLFRSALKKTGFCIVNVLFKSTRIQTEWPCGGQFDQSFTMNHKSLLWSPAVVSSPTGWVVKKKMSCCGKYILIFASACLYVHMFGQLLAVVSARVRRWARYLGYEHLTGLGALISMEA